MGGADSEYGCDCHQPDFAVVLHHQGEGQEAAVAFQLLLRGTDAGAEQVLQVRGAGVRHGLAPGTGVWGFFGVYGHG